MNDVSTTNRWSRAKYTMLCTRKHAACECVQAVGYRPCHAYVDEEQERHGPHLPCQGARHPTYAMHFMPMAAFMCAIRLHTLNIHAVMGHHQRCIGVRIGVTTVASAVIAMAVMADRC